jgi:hypothetical protein
MGSLLDGNSNIVPTTLAVNYLTYKSFFHPASFFFVSTPDNSGMHPRPIVADNIDVDIPVR